MQIDVYSSSVCVCVCVCVCACVVCDYVMNEVKCGYTFFFLDDDTRLFDRACDL